MADAASSRIAVLRHRRTQALDAATFAGPRLAALRPEMVFEVYEPTGGSGFFAGPLSDAFVTVCLRRYEGVTALLPTFQHGVVLDAVRDDPLDGDFFEVEWW